MKKGSLLIGATVSLSMIVIAIILWWPRETGSKRNDPNEPREPLDSWIRLPNDTDLLGWSELPKQNILRVEREFIPEAVNLLESDVIIPISDEQFSRFTKLQPIHFEGWQYYLVRAVALDGYRGVQFASTKPGMLWVRFGFLGRGTRQTVKSPLILMLHEEPKTVFVDLTGAI